MNNVLIDNLSALYRAFNQRRGILRTIDRFLPLMCSDGRVGHAKRSPKSERMVCETEQN